MSRALRRTVDVATAVTLGMAIVAGVGVRPAASQAPPDLPSGRLLVFSVPGLSWADLDRLELPALEAFAESAGLANLVPRTVFQRSDAGDAYLTISAGTRAAGVDRVDGEVLRVGEEPTEGNVGDVFERRTGRAITEGSVVLGWPELVGRNDDERFDAEIGLLAETLTEAGIATTVVGNADGTDEVGAGVSGSIQRQVGLALADSGGVVASGELGTDLLAVDPERPFGLRFDQARVTEAFSEVWLGGGADGVVAVVEASDVVRTMRYEPLVSDDRYTELRDVALREADALFAALLAEVDLEHDAVMVLAPYNENRRLGLTVTAWRAPGSEPGYLRTASTQRSGIVTLVDVAPTILDLFGVTPPDAMEGRPFEFVRSGDSLDERVEHLVTVNEASRFREHLLTPTTFAVVLGLAAVTSFAAAALSGRWSGRARFGIRFASLVILASLPASYLARAFPLEDLGIAFYWGFLVAAALALSATANLVGDRLGAPNAGLVAVLGLMLAVLVLDAMTGSHLSLNAAFGYSPTANSRLYGISNYSYGMVAAAACLLASFLAALPARWGRRAGVGLLTFVLLVLGVPTWGSDVGGVLAFTPALLLFAAVLFRYRVRLRTVLVAGLVTVAAVTAFGLLDLSRPRSQRAHLGRLFERIDREGLDPLTSIVERKLLANLRVSASSFWVVAIPIGIVFWLFLARHRNGTLGAVRARIPTLQAGLAASATAAVLGSFLNDSGAIVGGVALTVVAASLAFLATESVVDPEPVADPTES